jgi:hypothetical protein
MTAWAAATKAFTVIQGIFNAVMAANPLVLLAVGIAALVVGLIIAYKKFDAFRDIVDAVFSAIKTGIKGGMDAITTYLSFVMGVYKAIFNGIATLWNNTIGKLSFEVPKWVPGLGGKGFEVPNIPMLANGGIVTSPTLAMIGEGNGPEAVIPLNRMNEFGMGGGMNVTVQAGLISTPDQMGQLIIEASSAPRGVAERFSRPHEHSNYAGHGGLSKHHRLWHPIPAKRCLLRGSEHGWKGNSGWCHHGRPHQHCGICEHNSRAFTTTRPIQRWHRHDCF